MILSMSGDNYKVLDDSKGSLLFTDCGDIRTIYVSESKTYKIVRIDGKPFDGTEKVDVQVYGNNKMPESLHEIIEHEVNLFSLMQTTPESNLFEEFEYYLSEDGKEIIVEPKYKENENNVEINIPYDNPLILGMSFSKHKVGREKRR